MMYRIQRKEKYIAKEHVAYREGRRRAFLDLTAQGKNSQQHGLSKMTLQMYLIAYSVTLLIPVEG